MKIFIKKLVAFIFVFVIIVIFLIILLVKLNKNLFENYPTKQIHTVFIGDSHMEMGLNDKLIPGSINLSKSSDGYIHSYAKLKAFLEKENDISTVVLSYSAHNLSSYFNTFIDGHDAPFGFSDYFPIMAGDEQYELLRRNKLLPVLSLSLVFKKGFLNLYSDSGKYSFLGRYAPQEWQLTDYRSIDKRIRIQFYKDGELIPFSDIQLDYLNKVIQLCSIHGAKLFLLEMPVHQHYMKQIPLQYDSAIKAVIKDKPVSFMHCRQLQLPDSLFLPDGDHVNRPGGDTTTKYIGRLLNLSN